MIAPFFEIVIHQNDDLPDLRGLCAGFESRKWRAEQLVSHVFNYLPEFALNPSQFAKFNGLEVIPQLRNAARNIYQTKKFTKRGEFGELFLHAIIRETHNTIPAISKIFYKDSTNDTVKGFDAVHIVDSEDGLELWLGEVKFYKNISKAISDVVTELHQHTETRYLKDEFMAITNKIDSDWPHAEDLARLLNPNTSLDDIFDTTCVPVLLTYDSHVLNKYERRCEDYISEIGEELSRFYSDFCSKLGEFPLTIHLFLLPLNTKSELISLLDDKLRTWQNL